MRHSLDSKQLIPVCILFAALLFPLTVHAADGCWHDAEGFTRIWALPRSQQFSFGGGAEKSMNERNSFNGRLSDESQPAQFKGPAGSWYCVDLKVPDTLGHVELQPQLVRVHLSSRVDYQGVFKVQVCNSDDAAAGPWKTVGEGNTRRDAGKVADFKFATPEPCRFVRIVKEDRGWLGIAEIELWGKPVADSKAAAFVHPGTQVTRELLDRMKESVSQGTHPARITRAEIEAKWQPVPYEPKPVELYQVLKERNTESNLSKDGEQAYGQALAWHITGNEIYAQNVVRICQAWSRTNKRFGQTDPALHVGLWTGALVHAADIVKGLGYPGWDRDTDRDFKLWLNQTLIPLLETQLQYSNTHGNWSSLSRRTAMACAVFMDDRYHFNRMVELQKMHLADDHCSAPWGEINETCRTWPPDPKKSWNVYSIDKAHLQMGVAGFIGAAETAWNQGVDLYGWAENQPTAYDAKTNLSDVDFHDCRIANCVEYTLRIIAEGNAVKPFPKNIYPHPKWPGSYLNGDGSPYQGENPKTTPWGWEIAWYHYSQRQKIQLPFLREMIDTARKTDRKWDGFVHSIGYGSLTHAAPAN